MKLSLEDERERLAAYKTTAEHFRGREGGSERIARLHQQRKLVTALEQLEQARNDLYAQSEAFNSAINFALSPDANLEGMLFLSLWREGDWEGLAKEFPEFKQQEVGNE